MPRYKRADRDEALRGTRHVLLEAAAQEFAREGYDRANVDRISRLAGFAKGTIYNYFDSKRTLMLSLIAETAEAHVAYVGERVLQEQDAQRRLTQFFEAGWSFVSANLARGRAMVNAIYGSDAEFKRALWEAYRPMHELVGRDILAIGVAQGTFRPVALVSTAQLIMNLYLGIASLADDNGNIWLQSGEVSDFVWNAVRTPKRS